mmetsp:Transcript_8899/g.19573  ORF Transcript_8899/g.19573 Transcript_8899/m.19573 type:complete len:268 (-) Transcript_8899:498-1301(-)
MSAAFAPAAFRPACKRKPSAAAVGNPACSSTRASGLEERNRFTIQLLQILCRRGAPRLIRQTRPSRRAERHNAAARQPCVEAVDLHQRALFARRTNNDVTNDCFLHFLLLRIAVSHIANEEVVQQQLHGWRPVAHVVHERGLDETLRGRGDPPPLYLRDPSSTESRGHLWVAVVKGHLTSEHKVQAETSGPDVNAFVPHEAEAQLRCCVKLGAAVCEHDALARGAANARGTIEIRYLQLLATVCEQQVVWLQVAVHHTLAMKVADAR